MQGLRMKEGQEALSAEALVELDDKIKKGRAALILVCVCVCLCGGPSSCMHARDYLFGWFHTVYTPAGHPPPSPRRRT